MAKAAAADGKEAGARREAAAAAAAGIQLGRVLRAHLRKAGRGSRPRAALGTGASAAARPRALAGVSCAPPPPRPWPRPPALSEVLKSRPPWPLGSAQQELKSGVPH